LGGVRELAKGMGRELGQRAEGEGSGYGRQV